MENESMFLRQESNESEGALRISRKEAQIINSVTDHDREIIKGLKRQSLAREKEQIIGVRAEDIFYLFESVHNGYLSVGSSDIRRKGGDRYFFMTPNPESASIKEDGEMFHKIDKRYSNFDYIVDHTIRMYGSVAIAQGVYRNIWDRVSNKEGIAAGMEDGTIEQYFDHLASEISHSRALDMTSDRYPMAKILHDNLDPTASRDDVNSFLRSLKQRSGILLAFDKSIMEKSARVTFDDEQVLDLPGEEMAVQFPDGKISLDAIVGYEVLGDFEESVEEAAGISK